MEYVEVGKLIAQLGLIPALGMACIILWRKWWEMVDKQATTYAAVISEKDLVIADLTAKNEALGEKRLEEYRAMVTDYRNTLSETNRRDDQLAAATSANQRLLEQLISRWSGA